MKILSTASDNFIHFFYPTYCLHCDGAVRKAHHLLCPSCFQLIEWIDRAERCPHCWGPKKCKQCPHLHPHRSLFEPCGPILPLHQEFFKTNRAKTLASLIVIALAKIPWPTPDIIIPLTDSPFPKKEPIYALAKELALLLECSHHLPAPSIQDLKVLLLVDVLYKTGQLIEGKRALAEYFPEKIYTMALIDRR